MHPDNFSLRWRVARACARCHRLKSKCVYNTPDHDVCNRCQALGIACSVERDPTAQTAKRRNVRRPTRPPDQILQKVERLLKEAEKELLRMPAVEQAADHDIAGLETLQNYRLTARHIMDTADGIKTLTRQFFSAIDGLAVFGENAPGANAATHASVGSANESVASINAANINAGGSLTPTDDVSHNTVESAPLEKSPCAPREFVYSLISETEARSRYKHFYTAIVPYCPIVVLPTAPHSFDHAIKTCPLLALACLYVTTISGSHFSTKQKNRELGRNIMEYLDRKIAQKVYMEAGDFSYHIVYAGMILSVWGVPPLRAHQYKSQMDLVTAYSVCMCMDAGNVLASNSEAVANDDSAERNNLRSFLAVYCCCGLLSFSLPRFTLATWSPKHDAALRVLSRHLQEAPISRSDRFLCFYARIIHQGETLSKFYAENGGFMNFLTSEEERGSLSSFDPSRSRVHSKTFIKLVADLTDREIELTQLVDECGILSNATGADVPVGERYCLLFTYYYLIMLIHDHLVSWCICHLTADMAAHNLVVYFPDLDRALVVQHIVKFGETCERILDCFIAVNTNRTNEYPTFFYYRSLTALVSLIRLLVLLKSDIPKRYFGEVRYLNFRLKPLYQDVQRIMKDCEQRFDLRICQRFANVLDRIGRWVQVVDSNDKLDSAHKTHDIDFLHLTKMSKGQEIEKLADPTPVNLTQGLNHNIEHHEQTPSWQAIHHGNSEFPDSPQPHFSIAEMFKGIDEDIVRYLNPFDTLDAGFPFSLD